jgi:mono/diheme cytochrome c family protein
VFTKSPRRATILALSAALAAAAACASTSNNAAPAAPAGEPAPAAAAADNAPPPQTFNEQVALGQTLYGRHCAECHGAGGQGDTAPRVVGLKEGALPLDPPAGREARKSKFVTVGDVATFVVANMPPKKAGSLTPEQYWSILAFDLHANGIDLPNKLTPEVAASLTIPR